LVWEQTTLASDLLVSFSLSFSFIILSFTCEENSEAGEELGIGGDGTKS
jgi:hypothetical protein